MFHDPYDMRYTAPFGIAQEVPTDSELEVATHTGKGMTLIYHMKVRLDIISLLILLLHIISRFA